MVPFILVMFAFTIVGIIYIVSTNLIQEAEHYLKINKLFAFLSVISQKSISTSTSLHTRMCVCVLKKHINPKLIMYEHVCKLRSVHKCTSMHPHMYWCMCLYLYKSGPVQSWPKQETMWFYNMKKSMKQELAPLLQS